MGQINYLGSQKKTTFKLIITLLIISLVFTSFTAFVNDNIIYAAGTEVTLDPNGGQLTDKNVVELKDNTYSVLKDVKDPVRTGHDFAGWFTTKTGGDKILPETNVTKNENHTIYAQWKPRTYTVNFNGKGGSVSKKSMTVSYGSKYGTLASATKKGYGLVGWYTSTGIKITPDSVHNLTGNITLYAKWGKKYKMIFNGNKGKVGKKSKYVTKGLKYGTLPVPKRKGYTFTGWYTKKSGGSIIIADKKVNIKKNTNLYARWKLTNYTVTFDAGKGKTSKSKKKINFNKNYGKLPKASRKGYTFKGWYTKKSGGSKVSLKSKYKLTKNRTLYARWKAKKIKIKFNANKGKVSKRSKSVTFDKKFGKMPKPKRKGYKFKGWHSKKSGGTKLTKTSKVKYAKNKTLYAKWAKISTLSFNYNKGKKGKTKSKKIVYSEKYGSLPSAKRAGYSFRGWFTKKSGGFQITSATVVKAKKNQTIYARWESTMDIKKIFAPEGSKCRPGSPLNFAGVTIHNTGNKSKTADAMNHAAYLQGSGKNKTASWHYCVDESVITQSIPENEMAWHAGDGGLGFGNSRTIAIEICMNDGGNLEAATDKAAKLTAFILSRYGHKTALSGKNLFQHYHHSGKNCPEMIRKGKPYGWSTFIGKVNSYL